MALSDLNKKPNSQCPIPFYSKPVYESYPICSNDMFSLFKKYSTLQQFMFPDIPCFTTKYGFFTNCQGQKPLLSHTLNERVLWYRRVRACTGMLCSFAHISLRSINIPPHPEETTITVRKTGSNEPYMFTKTVKTTPNRGRKNVIVHEKRNFTSTSQPLIVDAFDSI